MKKILSISLLFLCSLLRAQISQFSPIWTYTGSNIQYTHGATLTSSLGVNTTYTNSLTNFNLIHGTSTISMGSQSAGNPALWLGGGADATNYSLAKSGSNLMLNTGGANLYFQTGGGGNRGTWNSTGLRIGSGSNPTAVLDVTGDAKVSSTFSLGSANLTGGNTGTVAVLSDVVIPYDFKCASAINPANATSYYFSNINQPTWGTSTSANSILMPYNATLIGYHINYIVNGTLGSSETATLQITASGSSTNILTSLTFSNAPNSYTSSATSINVSAGDLISARINTPTWGTPPTNIRMGITFLFVRRS